MCITISKYEKNIDKLSNLLKVFNDKYIRLNNEMLDINLINCPNELKQKCIEFDNDNHTCCICLDPIKTGIKTSCNHIFHIYCIKNVKQITRIQEVGIQKLATKLQTTDQQLLRADTPKVYSGKALPAHTLAQRAVRFHSTHTAKHEA